MNDEKKPAGPDVSVPKLPALNEQQLDKAINDSLRDILQPGQQKLVRERLRPQIERLVSISIVESKFHSGPLPSIELVQGYEAVLPGSFERILTMAETDQTAVISSQAYAAKSDSAFRVLCLVCGLGALFCILAAIIYLATHGHGDAALGVAGLGGAGIISAFINARFTPRDPPPAAPPPPKPQRV